MEDPKNSRCHEDKDHKENIDNFIRFLGDLELLKSVTRHSWTSKGRHESVPEHTWRICVMALALEKEFPEIDMNHVIRMCLVHDLGETYDGDIPAFNKQPENKDELERNAVKRLVTPLEKDTKENFLSLFDEFAVKNTDESRFAHALDKLEAVIQHIEADISTWAPIEYEYNLLHGTKEAEFSGFTKELKKALDENTKSKIENSRCNS